MVMQGRGNVINILVLVLVLFVMLLQIGVEVKNYNVGGVKDWDYLVVVDMGYYDKWVVQ